MNVTVYGKGGNGRSTIVTLLANDILNKGYQVLVKPSEGEEGVN